MAFVTRINASGAELNTPWPQVSLIQNGTLQQQIAFQLVSRFGIASEAMLKVIGATEVSSGVLTTSPMVEAAEHGAVYMFVIRRAAQSYDFVFAIGSVFVSHDEALQDRARNPNLAIGVGTERDVIGSATDGVAHDSFVLTVGSNMMFCIHMRDTRIANNGLKDVFEGLEVL